MAAEKGREAPPAAAPPPVKPSSISSGSMIAAGCRLEGQLNFTGPVRVAGEIRGDIACDGLLVIEAGGHVEGRVTAADITVLGAVLGEVIVSRRLEVGMGARVEGSIYSPSMRVEGNARIDGDVLIAPERSSSHIERAKTLPALQGLAPSALAAPAKPAVSNVLPGPVRPGSATG